MLVEEQGQTYMAGDDRDSDEARVLRPLQAAAYPYRIAFGAQRSTWLRARLGSAL